MAAPKPAMKFSLGGPKKPTKATLPTDRKRPRNALGEDEEEHTNQGVAITGFADGGVIEHAPTKKEEALVIKALPNRDWREESKRKRQRSGLPGGGQVNGEVTEEEIRAKTAKVIEFGLTVTRKEDKPTEESGDTVMEDVSVEEPAGTTTTDGPGKKGENDEITDEAAVQALLEGRPADTDLVIARTEEEAFERDIHTAPDAPSLADYEAMPVESFALAYLKGYGYKEGQELDKNNDKKKKETKVPRRPALLGIGAKEDAAVGVELGAWGKGGGGGKGKRKVDESYNPIVMRNRETGETLTEEELQKKLEQQKLVEEEDQRALQRRKRSPSPRDSDYRSERSSRKYKYNDDDDGERQRRKEREREKHRDRDDKNSDRERDRRRDRSRDRKDYDRKARDREGEKYKYRDSDRDRDGNRRRDHDSKYSSSRKDRDRRDNSPDDGDRKRKWRDYDDERDSDSKRRYKEGRYKDDKYYERGSLRRDDREREKYKSSSRR